MEHGPQDADACKRLVSTPAQSHLVLPVGLPVPPAVQVGRGQRPEPVGSSATQCKGAAVKYLQGSSLHLQCCKDTFLDSTLLLPTASEHLQRWPAVTYQGVISSMECRGWQRRYAVDELKMASWVTLLGNKTTAAGMALSDPEGVQGMKCKSGFTKKASDLRLPLLDSPGPP